MQFGTKWDPILSRSNCVFGISTTIDYIWRRGCKECNNWMVFGIFLRYPRPMVPFCSNPKIVLIFFVEHDLDFPKLQQLFKNIYKIKSYISKCASKNIFRDSFWKISKFYKDSSQKSIFQILTFVKNPYRILRFSKNFQKV